MKVMLPRIGFLIGVFAVVFLILLYLSTQPKCVKTSIGTIAEKSSNFEGCRITLTNAINGEVTGHYVRYKSTSDHRYDVVLSLKRDDPEEFTVFRCYNLGLMEDRIPGCPFDPPFIFLMDGEPIRPAL